jgi:hypothetical protein
VAPASPDDRIGASAYLTERAYLDVLVPDRL